MLVDHLGRKEQVVDGDEIEPAVELLEEEPLGCRGEEGPIDRERESDSKRRPLPARLPPAFRQQGEIEHQRENAPGGDPEVEHRAGGETVRQRSHRVRQFATPGDGESRAGQRAQCDEKQAEAPCQPETGAEEGLEDSRFKGVGLAVREDFTRTLSSFRPIGGSRSHHRWLWRAFI